MNLERFAYPILSPICIVLIASQFLAAGCGPKLPSRDELAAFQEAGPVRPTLDLDKVMQGRPPAEPYRVVKGDVLELTMPDVVRAVEPEFMTERWWRTEPRLCRVTDAGTIVLPEAGEVPVAGKKLSEVEALVGDAYYPKYVTKRPSVVARVLEYQTLTVSVVGAVKNPGFYPLRSDEMTLVAAIMKAGGIEERGASAVRINRQGAADKGELIVMPVKGWNMPFADIPLEGGDIVEVEHLQPQELMVMGLVNKPGLYPYPVTTHYNLQQALAIAGGVDTHLNPRYAKVYRQAEDGKVIAAAFKLDGAAFTEASNLILKPGDVISVDHTAATSIRQFYTDLIRVGFGLSAGYDLTPE